MNYHDARAAHAAGSAVTCGRGVRAPGAWNETFDLPGERESVEWHVVNWSEVVKAKKNTKPGNCVAMRCKAGVATGSTVNPLGLCEKHLDEWTSAGCPPLDADSAPEAPQELEQVSATLVVPISTAMTEYLPTVSTIVLDNQPALDWLGAVREGARQALAALEESRTSITKPMNEAKRKVDALFAPAKDRCTAVMTAIDARLNEYRRLQRQWQEQALTQIANGNRDDATIAHAHLTGPSLPGQVTPVTHYPYEVTDFAIVPDMFKVIDDAALSAYIKQRHGRVSIPGIAVQEVQEVRTAPGAANV